MRRAPVPAERGPAASASAAAWALAGAASPAQSALSVTPTLAQPVTKHIGIAAQISRRIVHSPSRCDRVLAVLFRLAVSFLGSAPASCPPEKTGDACEACENGRDQSQKVSHCC